MYINIHGMFKAFLPSDAKTQGPETCSRGEGKEKTLSAGATPKASGRTKMSPPTSAHMAPFTILVFEIVR
jgi:hypothetical protein